MNKGSKLLMLGLVIGGVLLTLAPAQAEKIVATTTGSGNAIGWPFYVALKKGFHRFCTQARPHNASDLPNAPLSIAAGGVRTQIC